MRTYYFVLAPMAPGEPVTRSKKFYSVPSVYDFAKQFSSRADLTHTQARIMRVKNGKPELYETIGPDR